MGYNDDIAEYMKSIGLPPHPVDMLKVAKAMKIDLLSCALWSAMIGVADRLPPEVAVEDSAKYLTTMLDASRTVTIP